MTAHHETLLYVIARERAARALREREAREAGRAFFWRATLSHLAVLAAVVIFCAFATGAV